MMFLVLIISCKKKENVSAENVNVTGTWELRYAKGIQVPGIDPNYKAGNGNLLVFTGNTFKKIIEGKVVDSGTYVIKPEVMQVNDKKSEYSIKFNNHEKEYLIVSNNKLVHFIGQIAADGAELTYEKLP